MSKTWINGISPTEVNKHFKAPLRWRLTNVVAFGCRPLHQAALPGPPCVAVGAVGVVFSFQAIELARPWLLLGLPLLHEMRINTAVASFAVICAILTACLTGIAPALRAARREKEGLAGREGVGLTPGRRRTNLVRTCVAAEVGLALMLLVGTGLLVRSALRAWQVDPGFDARNLLTMTVSLPENKVRVESQRGVCARGHRIGPLIAVCERRRSDSGAPNAFRELLRLRGHRRVCAEVGFR
jgi:hypothetical protein